MAAIFVIFSIVINLFSEIDPETLFIIHLCAVVGHITLIRVLVKIIHNIRMAAILKKMIRFIINNAK